MAQALPDDMRHLIDPQLIVFMTLNEGIKLRDVNIDMTEEGDILIKNKLSADIPTTYKHSVKIIKIYKEKKNIEGLKYELAMLRYMSELIQETYGNPKVSKFMQSIKNEGYMKKQKEMMDLRALIVNSWSQTLRFILDEEPGFNFVEYYATTPFGKDITITRRELLSTVKLTVEIIRTVLGYM